MSRQPAWLSAALAAIAGGEPAALVTVAEAKGSTPREAGAKMLVRARDIVGSIGGGQLELLAIDAARRMMAEPSARLALAPHSLGPDLGQCCGGAVKLLLEPLSAHDRPWLEAWMAHAEAAQAATLVTESDGMKSWIVAVGNQPRVEDRPGHAWRVLEPVRHLARPLWLYGAGHVGRALATVLSELDFDVTWLDSRHDGFPQAIPANVQSVIAPQLAATPDDAPAGCLFLVMTHSHQLDLDICDRILRRGDFAFLGLIGSDTKKARFLSGLRALGHGPATLERLVCPIGLAQIPGKQPMEIAVSVAAQLLALQDRTELSSNADRTTQGLLGAG
ncbi:MAG TPA: xanthine dehydrogenase accessory protein XdhC [Dongiaceae bacterium]|nr:xanthine dehydrogenase accessory protein XdhC [Dongiaceae bacterium]